VEQLRSLADCHQVEAVRCDEGSQQDGDGDAEIAAELALDQRPRLSPVASAIRSRISCTAIIRAVRTVPSTASVGVCGTSLSVGGNAGRVVVGGAGHETGTEDAEKRIAGLEPMTLSTATHWQNAVQMRRTDSRGSDRPPSAVDPSRLHYAVAATFFAAAFNSSLVCSSCTRFSFKSVATSRAPIASAEVIKVWYAEIS